MDDPGPDRHTDDPDAELVVALERRLLDPSVRRDRSTLERLLHEDFFEVGASGRTYDRDAVVTALADPQDTVEAAEGFRPVRLGPDAILLTYRTVTSLRTSVWIRDGRHGWRLRHHQGTPTAPAG